MWGTVLALWTVDVLVYAYRVEEVDLFREVNVMPEDRGKVNLVK
jgi:hypothetical protein